jgi:hypothetical protein
MNEALMINRPLVVIVAGILLNRQDVHALRSEIRGELQAFRGDMQAALQRQDTKMRDSTSSTTTCGSSTAASGSARLPARLPARHADERTKKPAASA